MDGNGTAGAQLESRGMPVQWMTERAYDDQSQAMRARRWVVTAFLRTLERKRLSVVDAPRQPKVTLDQEYFSEVDRDCRVLVAYIPDWWPSRHAGKHVVRVDTLVRA